MKITFLSNYYTHHQKNLCEELYKLTNERFCFIATEDFAEERKKLGWKEERPPFVCQEATPETVKKVVERSETVIFGSAPLSAVTERLEEGKAVFKYSERIFKNGYSRLKWLPRVFRYYKMYGRYKSLYLLSAGAFTVGDYAMHGVFRSKSYKWGYFPETRTYDTEALFEGKITNKLLWCGRFVEWKHPDEALNIALRLKNEGYDFTLDMIGTGEEEEKLRAFIKDNNLSDCVRIIGAMVPDAVRKEMEKAGIYLFTSDFREGWGAVLNEAMNSGCAVVASHAIGAVPYLIRHKENGLVYKNGDTEGLYLKVKSLLNSADEQKRLGMDAYRTITELWNAELAAKRFLRFAEEIKNKGYCDLYEEGPCSRAAVIKNNWFKE